VRSRVEQIDFPIQAVYRCGGSEATEQVARIVAQRFGLRWRDAPGLEELDLGLWQGLKRSEIKSRYPSAFARWKENSLSVNPPDGESLAAGIDRLRPALAKILKRNRDHTVAICVRPLAMQILAGILRLKTPEQIGAHLHEVQPVETIDISDEDLHRYLK
jgi:broad specificity phosphatase PhoE